MLRYKQGSLTKGAPTILQKHSEYIFGGLSISLVSNIAARYFEVFAVIEATRFLKFTALEQRLGLLENERWDCRT